MEARLTMSKELIKPKTFHDVVQSDAVKNRLKEVMGDRGPQFAAALIQIVRGSQQLQKCDPTSIIGAALSAAALDLSCDPNLGECHLVPYNDKCQLQIGYRGFIQLAQRSGQYKAIGSTPVCEGELVNYNRLLGELILDQKGKTSPLVIGYAAMFRLINGFERAEYWTADEIEAHASRYSKSYRYAKGKPDKEANCLWCTDRDKMALKTVEKSLLSHYGPKSIQMQKALKMDGGAVIDSTTGEVEYLDSPAVADAEPPKFEEPTKTIEVEVIPPKTAKTETKAPDPSPDAPHINQVKAMRGFMELAELKEAEVVNYLKVSQIVTAKTLEEIPEELLRVLVEGRSDLFAKIKKARTE